MTLYLAIAILLMLLGLLGVLIPVLPGIPFMFLITLIFGFVTKFKTLQSSDLIILGVMAMISLLVDYFSGILGAKFGGAAKKSIYLGFFGLIVGTIIFPPFGGIAGLFIAIFVNEFLNHNDHKAALKAASGSLFGSLAGILINLILAISFLVCFIIFALK